MLNLRTVPARATLIEIVYGKNYLFVTTSLSPRHTVSLGLELVPMESPMHVAL